MKTTAGFLIVIPAQAGIQGVRGEDGFRAPRTGANFRGNDGTRRTIFMVVTEVGFLYFMVMTTRGAGA